MSIKAIKMLLLLIVVAFATLPAVVKAAGVCANVPNNAVQDCGFESGVVNPWTVSNGLAFANYYANSGSYSLATSTGTFEAASQLLNTQPSQKYAISFYVYSVGNPPALGSQYKVSFGGTEVCSATTSTTDFTSGASFELFDAGVVEATSTSAAFEIQCKATSGDYVLIDDVVIEPTNAAVTLGKNCDGYTTSPTTSPTDSPTASPTVISTIAPTIATANNVSPKKIAKKPKGGVKGKAGKAKGKEVEEEA